MKLVNTCLFLTIYFCFTYLSSSYYIVMNGGKLIFKITEGRADHVCPSPQTHLTLERAAKLAAKTLEHIGLIPDCTRASQERGEAIPPPWWSCVVDAHTDLLYNAPHQRLSFTTFPPVSVDFSLPNIPGMPILWLKFPGTLWSQGWPLPTTPPCHYTSISPGSNSHEPLLLP